MLKSYSCTLPETNSSHLKIGHPKRKRSYSNDSYSCITSAGQISSILRVRKRRVEVMRAMWPPNQPSYPMTDPCVWYIYPHENRKNQPFMQVNMLVPWILWVTVDSEIRLIIQLSLVNIIPLFTFFFHPKGGWPWDFWTINSIGWVNGSFFQTLVPWFFFCPTGGKVVSARGLNCYITLVDFFSYPVLSGKGGVGGLNMNVMDDTIKLDMIWYMMQYDIRYIHMRIYMWHSCNIIYIYISIIHILTDTGLGTSKLILNH